MALGSTQPLTEMSTRILQGGKGWPACKADNLSAIYELIIYKIIEASMSHKPMGFHSLLQGQLHLSNYSYIISDAYMPFTVVYLGTVEFS
jgi:hypothetical protein